MTLSDMTRRTQEKTLEEMINDLQELAKRASLGDSAYSGFLSGMFPAPKQESFPFPYGPQSAVPHDWFEEDEQRLLKEIARDAEKETARAAA